MSTAALAPSVVQFLDIPLEQLRPSPLNPRKRMTGLDELTASIREVGILEPLVARPVDDGFEVIAGGRRLEGARLAGLASAPCTVRPLTDEQALELAIIENNQRGDIHPLEEAEAFARLRELDPGHTPASIAAKIGRPTAYVVQRLRLLSLVPEAREAFAEHDITIGHAHLLAGLTPEQQEACLSACFEYALDFDEDEDGGGEPPRVAAPVARLKEHIRETVALDVASAEAQAEFPELAAATTAAAAEGATVLMLADKWGERPDGPNAPLPRSYFVEVDQDEEGAVRGVFVVGRRQGRMTWVKVLPPPEARAARQTTLRSAEEKAAEKERKRADQKREADRRAAMARRQQVQITAVQQLVAKTSEPGSSWGPPQVRVLVEALVGMDTFDRPVLEAAATALQVPVRVFDFSGSKERLKLSAPKLAQVMAILAVGQQSEMDRHVDDGADVWDAFGVDVKAIDKALAKQLAAAAPAAKPTRRKAR